MVICWVFHDESHISWYLYWLSIHRGTGHPSQPRVVPLAGPRSLGDCSAKKLMTRGYRFHELPWWFLTIMVINGD
jgi:hypothetical protein